MESINNIAIVTNSKEAYSESFIQAHIKHLPFVRHVLYGGRPPLYSATTGESFVVSKKSIMGKIYLKLLNKVFKETNKSQQLKAIAKYLKKNQVELVFAEYGTTGAEILPVCKALNLPLVVHFHGYDAYILKTLNRYSASYKDLFAYSSAIIAVSRNMMEQLQSLGAPLNKLHYNLYGVEIDKFKQGCPEKALPILIAIGRFVEKKAPYLTLLAFKKALKAVPDAKLVFVGDGILMDVCKQMAHSLEMGHAVEFKGVLPHNEVSKLLKKARGFVQHSITPSSGDSEGTPNSILEASASGLPVISTSHAGIKDVIKHGHSGFLVEEGDIKGMSRYMIEILTHPEMAREIGAKGRSFIVKHCSMQRSIDNLWKIISNAR